MRPAYPTTMPMTARCASADESRGTGYSERHSAQSDAPRRSGRVLTLKGHKHQLARQRPCCGVLLVRVGQSLADPRSSQPEQPQGSAGPVPPTSSVLRRCPECRAPSGGKGSERSLRTTYATLGPGRVRPRRARRPIDYNEWCFARLCGSSWCRKPASEALLETWSGSTQLVL
jgi:hypothetical protein